MKSQKTMVMMMMLFATSVTMTVEQKIYTPHVINNSSEKITVEFLDNSNKVMISLPVKAGFAIPIEKKTNIINVYALNGKDPMQTLSYMDRSSQGPSFVVTGSLNSMGIGLKFLLPAILNIGSQPIKIEFVDSARNVIQTVTTEVNRTTRIPRNTVLINLYAPNTTAPISTPFAMDTSSQGPSFLVSNLNNTWEIKKA